MYEIILMVVLILGFIILNLYPKVKQVYTRYKILEFKLNKFFMYIYDKECTKYTTCEEIIDEIRTTVQKIRIAEFKMRSIQKDIFHQQSDYINEQNELAVLNLELIGLESLYRKKYLRTPKIEIHEGNIIKRIAITIEGPIYEGNFFYCSNSEKRIIGNIDNLNSYLSMYFYIDRNILDQESGEKFPFDISNEWYTRNCLGMKYDKMNFHKKDIKIELLVGLNHWETIKEKDLDLHLIKIINNNVSIDKYLYFGNWDVLITKKLYDKRKDTTDSIDVFRVIRHLSGRIRWEADCLIYRNEFNLSKIKICTNRYELFEHSVIGSIYYNTHPFSIFSSKINEGKVEGDIVKFTNKDIL